MSPFITAIAAFVMMADQAAYQHWEQHANKDHSVRYLSLEAVDPKHYVEWENAMMFAIPSASRAVSLESHLPRRVAGSKVYYIDLDRLKWDFRDLNTILEKYPYQKNDPNQPLLVIRGDWLIQQLADTRDSQAMYLLLYGSKNIPKTDGDFLKFWGVDEKEPGVSRFGWVETDSQVNLQGTRFVERFVGRDGKSVWRTKDGFFVKNGNDPLETLNGNFLHQGRELIAQFPKVSGNADKRILGSAQAYLLSTGNADGENKPLDNPGSVVQEAPVRLVEDWHRFLNQTAIITNGSCIICHDAGMKFPTENGLASRLKAGVKLWVNDEILKEDIEAFHLTDVGRQITRDNEDYSEFVRACNGLTTLKNSQNYKAVTLSYSQRLPLDAVCRELYTTPEELKLAIGYAAVNGIDMGVRSSDMLYGFKIPRAQFEDDYLKLHAVIDVWRTKNAAGAAAAIKEHDHRKVTTALVVTCPADCTLKLDGVEKKTQGEVRKFEALVPADWQHSFTLTASRTVDGKLQEVTETADCRAGHTTAVTVDFDKGAD